MSRQPGGDHDDEGLAEHAWKASQCAVCGLRRTETWVLDDQDRAVQALIWFNHAKVPVRAVAFAWMQGSVPALTPRSTLAEAFPGLAVGREPTCRADRFR